MKDINRLIIKAKRIYEPKKEQLVYAVIGYSGSYNTSCTVWNGIKGQARTLEAECDTREAAFVEIKRIAGQYPNRRDITVLDLSDNCLGVLVKDQATV